MSNAFTSGGRAEVSDYGLGEDMFEVDTYVFAVDHQVKIFWDHPEGDETQGGSWADETDCTGSFEIDPNSGCTGSGSLIVDGCPPPNAQVLFFP